MFHRVTTIKELFYFYITHYMYMYICIYVYGRVYTYTCIHTCTHRPSHAQSPGSMTITFFDKCPLAKKKKNILSVLSKKRELTKNHPHCHLLKLILLFPAVLFSRLLLLVRLT